MSDEELDLEGQLTGLCLLLDQQLEIIMMNADKLGVEPYVLRTPSGDWPMLHLLAAKAQALHSLVLVKEGNLGRVVNIFNGTSDEFYAGGESDQGPTGQA